MKKRILRMLYTWEFRFGLWLENNARRKKEQRFRNFIRWKARRIRRILWKHWPKRIDDADIILLLRALERRAVNARKQ